MMHKADRSRRERIANVVLTLLLLATVWFLAFLYLTPRSDAATPYGGCKEAVQVLDQGIGTQSEAVRDCRARGWLITKTYVVSPRGHAWTTLPSCGFEDSDRCYWDARHFGNGKGRGYLAVPGRTIYVDSVNGTIVTEKKYRGGMWLMVAWVG